MKRQGFILVMSVMFFIMLSGILSAGEIGLSEKAEVISPFTHQINQMDLETAYEFGPFFLPLNNNLDSISINYFTENPGRTTVFFAMMGDIDWARTDYVETNYHEMDFYNMEEDTEYIFSIPGNSSELVSQASVHTPPYGEVYEFEVAVGNMDNGFDFDNDPHFLILLSEEETVSLDSFEAFYTEHSDIISSTLILPLFELDLNDKVFNLSTSGFYSVAYGKLNLVMIYDESADVSSVSSYFGTEAGDVNCIVFGDVSEDFIVDVCLKNAYQLHGIFTLNEVEGIDTYRVEDYRMIEISTDSDEEFIVDNEVIIYG